MFRGLLEAAGIPVYDNDVVRLTKSDWSFWLAGLGDQLAFLPARRFRPVRRIGSDDLDATRAGNVGRADFAAVLVERI
jgi:uncharacterized protein